jgi:MoaA/NifB/PqqE/SkfB family radical SAM enzyme
VEIVEYIRNSNAKCHIQISTNASGKPRIWEKLSSLGVEIMFRLDGLADTHHLYRQNTDFDFIINNAKKFIAASKNNPRSKAIWAMIPFNHNRHQISDCRSLSQELGFHKFQLVDAGRDTMPVFNSKKQLTHIIGDYTGSKDFDEIHHEYSCYISDPELELRKYQPQQPGCSIACPAKRNGEIYVSANGEVYPCCWLGFYPNHGAISRPTNFQLRPLIFHNNALEYGLAETIEWFANIEQTWAMDSVSAGRIMTCDSTCGVKP